MTGLSNSSTAVQSYLNQHYTVVPPSGVPPTLFQPNHVYLISAQLCNFLGACGRSSVQVSIRHPLSFPIETATSIG